jgi:hypothetical protein
MNDKWKSILVPAIASIVIATITSFVAVSSISTQLKSDINVLSRNNAYDNSKELKIHAERFLHLTTEAVSKFEGEVSKQEKTQILLELDKAVNSLYIYSGPNLGVASYKLVVSLEKGLLEKNSQFIKKASYAWMKTYYSEITAYDTTSMPDKENAKYDKSIYSYLTTLKL